MKTVTVQLSNGEPALLEVQGTHPIKLNKELITSSTYRASYKALEVIAGGRVYSLEAFSYFRAVHNQDWVPGL